MDLEHHMKYKKVEVLDYEDYAEMLDKEALKEFRSRALTPNNPVTEEQLKTQIFISKLEKLQINSIII